MLAKLTFIFIAAFAFCIPARSQEPCQKTIAEAPAVFKLKLGMTFEQMKSILGPAFKFKPKKTGVGSYFVNFIDQPAPNSLPGVRAAYLRFFDHKIYQIEIFYEDEGKTIRLEDFTTRISPELGVQNSSWNFKNGTASVDCSEFTIRADAPLNPRLLMTHTTAEAAFQKSLKDTKKSSKSKS